MIKKSKVAIFSDLHLGIYGNSTDWHDIALKWAGWIASDLKKKKIKDIFFLGDFFHNRSEISVQTVHVASLILEKLKDFNIFMIDSRKPRLLLWYT
jgi:metallophosphoesterase superfamily enzyme